jgi:hypothetical protein
MSVRRALAVREGPRAICGRAVHLQLSVGIDGKLQ